MINPLLHGEKEVSFSKPRTCVPTVPFIPVEVHLQLYYATRLRGISGNYVWILPLAAVPSWRCRDSEERFRTIVNTIPQLAWIARNRWVEILVQPALV